MLTSQGVRLEQSLIEGGVNPLAANRAMSAVANCAQPIVHRGPVSVDATPIDFKFVTAALRKYRFPNLDSVSGEMPRIRPPREEKPPEEDRTPLPPERENTNVRPDFQPTRTNPYANGVNIAAGPFIRVDGRYRVSLNGTGGNGQLAVYEGNYLRGRALEIKSANEKALKVERSGLTFTLKPNGGPLDVVTGIAVDGERLIIEKRPMFGFDLGQPYLESIELEQVEYVYDVVDSGSAITFKKESRLVLGTPAEEAGPISIPVADCTV